MNPDPWTKTLFLCFFPLCPPSSMVVFPVPDAILCLEFKTCSFQEWYPTLFIFASQLAD